MPTMPRPIAWQSWPPWIDQVPYPKRQDALWKNPFVTLAMGILDTATLTGEVEAWWQAIHSMEFASQPRLQKPFALRRREGSFSEGGPRLLGVRGSSN
jgi:hypothetical protein